ncbi:MAG TPA: hypothetical protein VJH04_00535 [archaeon]|nr:hypothetical protein [archaeon]
MIPSDRLGRSFYNLRKDARAPNACPGKKGQYRVISEILLFFIGILITSFVIINFGNLETSIRSTSLHDQLESVGDSVATAIVKVATSENATIRLAIPDQVSGYTYVISIKDVNGGEMTVSTFDGNVSIKRQIFNIDYDNTVIGNHVVNNSEVVSSAGFIEIIKNEKITIARSK